MLFSLIVPIYNSQNTLRQCINSVLDQTYAEFELILVDDGSNDHSFDICCRYAELDERIRVVKQENQGHTAARNAGLLIAKGSYIIFLDSDDWLEKGLLQSCYEELKKTFADLIIYGYNERTESGSIERSLQEFQGYYYKGNVNNKFFERLIMSTNGESIPRALWGKAFKRELICKWQKLVPKEIITGEDMCCFIAAALDADMICVIPGVYYNYRITSNSLSRKNDRYALTRCCYTMQFLEGIIQENETFVQQAYRLAIQQMYSSLIRSIRSEISKEEVFEQLRKLKKQSICEKALRLVKFSAFSYKVKYWVVKYELFTILKIICNIKYK